jgi:hypothetical protein
MGVLPRASGRARSKLAKVLLLLGVLGGASAWLLRLGWLGIPFVLEQHRTALGGPWVLIDESSVLGHASTRQRLVRQLGPFVRTVGENLGRFAVLNGDCLVFEQTPRVDREVGVACGMRRPIILYRGMGRLSFEADALRVEGFVDGEIETILHLTFVEIVAKGRGE